MRLVLGIQVSRANIVTYIGERAACKRLINPERSSILSLTLSSPLFDASRRFSNTRAARLALLRARTLSLRVSFDRSLSSSSSTAQPLTATTAATAG